MSKSNKKKYDELTREITGILIISLGVLSFTSLINDKTGIIGMFLRNMLLTLFGLGGFLFPLIIITIGILLIINKGKIQQDIKSIYMLIMFLCLLALSDIFTGTGITLSERISNSFELSKNGLGGGFIGATLGYFLMKLFGIVGSYIIIAFILITFIFLFTKVRIKDAINKFNIKKRRLDKEKSERPIRIPTLVDEKKGKIDKKIVIHDHIKDEKKIINTEETDKKDISPSNNNYLIEDYSLPPLNLLSNSKKQEDLSNDKEIILNAKKIEETLNNFGIDASIVQINRGPTITCYELQLAPGIKVSRIIGLSDDLSLNLATSDIRVVAPIPGKAAVGIEVPNRNKDDVGLKEIMQSEEYNLFENVMPLLLGKDISGNTMISNIDKMPHLLIAGATGSGKSTCLNTIIMGILFKAHPEEVKLLIIDPKVVELNIYNNIPHLLIPVVTEPKKAASALNWSVKEMERRYKIFAKNNVKDIKGYNKKFSETKDERLANIIIIIDELADLMMVAAQEIEDYICRLAQMARAAGIYLIIATQRPSVDVITGSIKANIPSRIAFAVSSQVDSRTILDMSGAEKLLGKGDMLFYPSYLSKPIRIQGAYITDIEIQRVVKYLKEQNIIDYNSEIIETIQNKTSIDKFLDDNDELLLEAANLVINEGQASISLLQRKLRIGYARAARIVDEMEELGIVGGHEGSKPRKVLLCKQDIDSIFNNEEI